MIARRPRILLGAAALGLVAVLAALTVALARDRDDERGQARQRFQDAAQITAALTRSIFSSGAPQSSAQLALTLGTGRVDRQALLDRAVEDKVKYALVLGPGGRVLAATPATPAAVRRRLQDRPGFVAPVLDGRQPYRLSSYVDGNTLEYALVFGDGRVLVEGFSPSLVNALLRAYLSQLPNATRQRAYVVDAQDRAIVGAEMARRVRLSGPGRTTVQAAVGGTEWRIVLSQRDADLYRGTTGHLQWIVLAGMGLAFVAAFVLLVGVVRRGRELERAHAELEEANAELRRSNAELADFAAVASHDLQEPLRKVAGFSGQLERRFGDQLPAEGRDYIARMQTATERMAALIDDLLRLSRVTTAAAPSAPVDLAPLAHDVVSDLGRLVADTDGTVTIGALGTVDADAVQMRQLLQNLIANGLKFHRDGVAPHVRVEPAPAPAGRAAFTVADNGIGFDAEYAERIFGVFERLHPRDVYEGTGIGLAVCRKIVDRHGGTITAGGRPDGAVFRVELPGAVARVREAVHA